MSFQIDNSNNNISRDSNFNDLIREKGNLQKKLREIYKIKNNIEFNIIETKKLIVEKCIEEFGEHKYIKEIESGMYGEKYYYCERCGKDKFSSAIYDI